MLKFRLLQALGLAATVFVTACGGGDEGSAEVSKVVSTFDLTGTAAVHAQQLVSAGAVVKSSRCHRTISTDVGVEPPPILFVYEVRAGDVGAAISAGFVSGASQPNFRPTSVPCVTPSPILPV